MTYDPFTITVLTILTLYAPVVLYRFVKFCKQYVTTGKYGEPDGGGFFSLMNHFHMPKFPSLYSEEAIPTWKQIFKNWFTATNPLSLMMDSLLVFAAAMIIAALITVPKFLMLVVAMILFISLLVIMRKRYAIKQTFVENLKGDQLDNES